MSLCGSCPAAVEMGDGGLCSELWEPVGFRSTLTCGGDFAGLDLLKISVSLELIEFEVENAPGHRLAGADTFFGSLAVLAEYLNSSRSSIDAVLKCDPSS